ncbi:MAG: hypothetical protein HWE16_06435 [Gammaproteobacteria bacterium]|nr:hypothetical protein [Gammaproteobacteria bacterium]
MTTTLPIENNSVETQELVTQIPNYGLTWFVYIALTFLMVGIIWYAIRKWHFVIKWFLASVVFAGALTPAHPAEGVESYSPMVLNAVVDLFDGNQAAFMSAVKTLGLVWAIIFVLGIAAWFVLKKLKPENNTSKMDTEAVMATPIEPKIED